MNVEELLVYGKEKIHSDLAKILLSDLLGKNPLELYLCLEEKVDDSIIERYKKEVEAIFSGTPIQYAIGHVQFHGNQFYVDKNVLIPRFETEELVEKTILYVKRIWTDEKIRIIDLGCGSGVIGLTLKEKLPQAEVTLLDISEEALKVAKKNQEALGLDVRLLQGDMLDSLEEKFDVIISNPPYIMEDEKIEEIVKNNEPHLALYAGKDGLQYYEQILKKASCCLNDTFLIAFEIGHTQKEAITSLASKYLSNVEVECLKDMQDRDRMLFIYSK